MRSLPSVAGAACLAVLTAAFTVAPASAAGDPGAEGFTIEDPRIKESSGLVASRVHPGIYWTHNDSDDGAFLYAVDARSGKTVARLTLTGVGRPRDVEAISMGPDGDLYVGDIGDNLGGTWNHVWIYRLPEPKKLVDRTVKAVQYVVKYADGARDAEALMVHPKTGRVYIADKKQDGNGSLYVGPEKLSPSGTNVFRRVGPIDLWVTDGAFSPDGEHLALRGYFGGVHYAWKKGKPKRVDQLRVPLQRQGESLAWTPDGKTLLYGSEGLASDVEPREAPGGAAAEAGKGGTAAAGDGKDGGGISTGFVLLALGVLAFFGVRRARRG
ncbi:WD40 repeat domain-containing protein [Streptomyces sp. LE64]|uniref:WD40 repeat domain-containing protein n=1 Tax=unclassified Streptomyces TaxID=2593676 RepID=UPI00332F5749